MKKIISSETFFQSFRTKKAMLLGSRWRHLTRFLEWFTGEHICDKCNMSTLVSEYPGEFRDWDADDEWGGDGTPLCTRCLGTGKYRKDEFFKDLQERAGIIRSDNFQAVRDYLIDRGISSEEYWEKIRRNNKALYEISQQALGRLKYPDKRCLAIELQKQDE
ncbi:MAG: hypothetical protein ACD_15C00133G0037 [uncultured bacterium]|nr:MAG: hypothetical protein ACD_15C00133G0037 [uncultured bacterium]